MDETMRASRGLGHDDCDREREQRAPAVHVANDEECKTSPKRDARLATERRPEFSAISTSTLILFMLFSTCSARPHDASPTEAPTPELPRSDRAHPSERTRILTFPRRPPPAAASSAYDTDELADHRSDIVFPDSLEAGGARVSFEPATRIDATPECAAAGGTFCEEIAAYPYRLLRDALSRSKSAAAASVLFGADETPDEIAQRIGEPEENYICGAVDKTVFPKAGKNKNNKWKYIINQGSKDGYVQGVRVELCISTGKPCDLFGSQPNGYVTSCKQKYIYRKMMSLSEGGQPMPDTFLMPSACCCSYRRDNRFLARFGGPPVTPAH